MNQTIFFRILGSTAISLTEKKKKEKDHDNHHCRCTQKE
jgi:hypothetical protein